jgi:hypothetical protein
MWNAESKNFPIPFQALLFRFPHCILSSSFNPPSEFCVPTFFLFLLPSAFRTPHFLSRVFSHLKSGFHPCKIRDSLIAKRSRASI